MKSTSADPRLSASPSRHSISTFKDILPYICCFCQDFLREIFEEPTLMTGGEV